MAFTDHIQDHLSSLEKQRQLLRRKQMDLLHDCDCEYCDRAGDVVDEDEEAYNDLEKQVMEIKETIDRVKRFAKLHNIEIPA